MKIIYLFGGCILSIYLFGGCNTKINLNKFLQNYNSCADTIISFYSGKEWEGLRYMNRFEYSWGLNQSSAIKGPITYYKKNHIGKGSIIKWDNGDWVIYKLSYRKHFKISLTSKKGGASPSPEYYNVILTLKKVCIK